MHVCVYVTVYERKTQGEGRRERERGNSNVFMCGRMFIHVMLCMCVFVSMVRISLH